MRFAIACLVLCAACFREPAARPATAPSNRVALSAPAVDYRATIADPLGFLPIESELVLSLDGDQLRHSALWAQLEPLLLAKAGGGLAMFKALCGIDPVASIRSIDLSLTGIGEDNPDGVFVIHGFARDPLMSCFRKAHPGALREVTFEGDAISIHATKDDPNTVVFQFVDPTTAVVILGVHASAAKLASILRAGSPLRRSAAFMDMFRTLDLSSSMWALITGGKVFDKVSSLGPRPRAMFGWVSLLDGLTMSVRLRVPTPADAAQIVGMAQGQLGQAKMFVDKLEVTADNADVVLMLAMTNQQVQFLVGLLGGMLGSSSVSAPNNP